MGYCAFFIACFSVKDDPYVFWLTLPQRKLWFDWFGGLRAATTFDVLVEHIVGNSTKKVT